MYRIGEFSKITGLTTQTLRYYDSEKILSPSYRNEENGYRYYNAEDIKKAEFITWLRKFNFSIMEMKDVLSNMKTQEDFNDFIVEDTFNKLGYKTKINTHTTSCINLFLDIYLYSEYRLIYC